jgi:malonyl-CoA O-methyltransferase
MGGPVTPHRKTFVLRTAVRALSGGRAGLIGSIYCRPMPTPGALRDVDPTALMHRLRVAYRAPQPPWLHAEVARRMAERLPVIRIAPARVIDWHAHLSGSRELLRGAYPRAQLSALDPWPPTLTSARRWWPLLPKAPTAITPQALSPGQADLLWANMALHQHADPLATFKQWHRTVAVGGFLMFSTLGPGTLVELAALYGQRGWPPPFAPFVDMHDLGDMLLEAGFADPVMDQETIQLTWPDSAALLAELRSLGGNTSPKRTAGLRTPRWRERLESALAGLASADGRPQLSIEIVYGHAFRTAPRVPLAAETALPLDDLRAMVRAGRGARDPGKKP